MRDLQKFNPKVRFDLPWVGFDLETHLIGYEGRPTNPPAIVASWCHPDADRHFLVKKDHPDYIDHLKWYLIGPHFLVGQRICYDLVVIALDHPELIPLIFDKYERGEVADIRLIEKMMNLARIGIISGGESDDYYRNEKVDRIIYDMGTLAHTYLGIDMSAEKKDPNSWRLRYAELEHIPLEDWPEDAKTYALDDTIIPLQILQKQLDVAPKGALDALGFICMNDFDMELKSTVGIYTHQDHVDILEDHVESQFSDDKLANLLSSGVYVKGSPPQPYKNGSLDHSNCPFPKGSKEQKQKLCGCPPKMSAATAPSKKEEPLKKHIIELIREGKLSPADIRISDGGYKDLEFMDAWKGVEDRAMSLGVPTGDQAAALLLSGRDKEVEVKGIKKLRYQPYFKYIAVNKEFQENYKLLDLGDPIIDEYIHYMRWQKLKTTEIPRMRFPILYPKYDPIKKTGRTSCYDGGQINKKRVFPSGNIQQIKAEVRGCFRPADDHYMISCDFKSMELVTAAQTCVNLFGQSALADQINKGYDVHAYLGAQIALKFDPFFSSILEEEPDLVDDPEEVYQLFMGMKSDDELKKIFKLYRTLAKPTGLGYWGGLGKSTWVTTAETIYMIDVEGIAKELYGEEGHEEDMAQVLKDIWLKTYPEAGAYFEYVKKNNQDWAATYEYWSEEEQKKKKAQRYKYKSHYGLVRSNCDYCKVMNGFALQTLGAEGAKTCMHVIVRESFDPTQNSVLYGNYRAYGFIHDEFFGDVRIGKEYEVAVRICDIMAEYYRYVCPDVVSVGEPAVMDLWDKYCESEFDHENRTINVNKIEYKIEEEEG